MLPPPTLISLLPPHAAFPISHKRYANHLEDDSSSAKGSLTMARYELTEFEWKTIRPLLPNKSRGVPRVDDRRILNGIFWVLRSGSPWADVPERYGPPTTIYNRFNRWRKAGIWDRLMDAIIKAHDGKVQMIDSSVVRVHQQAAAQKNKLETRVSVEVVED